nr:neutral and basic amino acid transport protein rBAT-like [Lytechinus pictus]
MGDDRKPEYDAKYEMAPQSEADLEKGEVKIADPSDEKKSADVDNEWGGLNKAELLEVADTPFWNWTRNILLILFWVGWLAMLVAAIVIVVKVPRCPEVEWWEKSVFYRVVPQSFKDSNGDGYGDLKGLTKKLDYVTGIGAGVLVLSSIYKQSEQQKDLGQEVVDFTNVDSRLGTLEDFDALMTAAEDQGLKVILEFVPNHSSNEHPWFLASRNRTGNYSDYYVWEDCDQANPPNDWLNKYGNSSWTYNAVRGQCYYHYLREDQPDFNYDNINVQMAIEDAFKFWFERRVDGFVFSDVDYIYESGDVATALGNRRRRQAGNETQTSTASPAISTTVANQPEPTSTPEPTSEPEPATQSESNNPSGGGASATQYSCVGDSCPGVQAKLHNLLVSWREVFNDKSYLGKYRLMVTETEKAPADAVLQFGNGTREADLVINLGFAKAIDGAPTVDTIQGAVASWLAAKDDDAFENRWNTWTLGDERMSRIASRAGEQFVRSLNFILLTLPGAPITYYGEELGALDTSAAGDDAFRGPMYWANFTNGNFTAANATAWQSLPTNPKYSVEVQSIDKKSPFSVYKELASLHGEPSMTAGEYTMIHASESVYAYLRQFPEWPGYLVITNFGSSSAPVDFEVKVKDRVYTEGKFKLSSSGMMPEKKWVTLSQLTVEPATSVLIEV